jgi:hypothetical protein
MIGRRPKLVVIVAAATVVGCASTAERRATRPGESPTMNQVGWDRANGTLGCMSGDAALTVPRELRDRVYVVAPDLVVVVPQPAGAALLVTVSPSFLRGKRAGVLGDLPEIWKELHKQATGVDLRDGEVQGTFRTGDDRVVFEYTYDPPPQTVYKTSAGPDFEPAADPPRRRIEFDPTRDRQWRVVYVEAGRCRIAAVDRIEAGDRPRMTPLIDELRIPAWRRHP